MDNNYTDYESPRLNSFSTRIFSSPLPLSHNNYQFISISSMVNHSNSQLEMSPIRAPIILGENTSINQQKRKYSFNQTKGTQIKHHTGKVDTQTLKVGTALALSKNKRKETLFYIKFI